MSPPSSPGGRRSPSSTNWRTPTSRAPVAAKRWEDVVALLDEGISVISALNVQHLESLNDVLQKTLGVTVRETVPDWVISLADQVINLDISAEDLRQRLLEGKIYAADKVATALTSFFTEENLATLRELALREVASSVDRAREAIAARADATAGGRAGGDRRTVDRILVAMSSHPEYTTVLLRKASRIAGRLNRDWYCVYVQTPAESAARIDAAVQRKLVENIQRAQGMGAEVVKLEAPDVVDAIRKFARERGVTLIIVGQSQRSWWQHVTRGSIVERLTRNPEGVDVLVVSLAGVGGRGMTISQRLYLAVVPAVVGVFTVAGLAYWGQFHRAAPEWVVVVAAVSAVGSLFLALAEHPLRGPADRAPRRCARREREQALSRRSPWCAAWRCHGRARRRTSSIRSRRSSITSAVP